MASVSHTALFAKIFKVLKKCYKPVSSNASRTVIEHLLFACCLEDAHYEVAEEAFAAMVHTFFDWNEVRVTSISELSEVLSRLPDPRAAANRIKRLLHSVFEATFSFDLEDKLKKNLGPTVAWLEKLDGATHFTVAYVVQAALGGHAIPIDSGTMAVMRLLHAVSEKDAASGAIPGLERAIAKSKGVEFGSLLHELGADYSANAYSPALRAILVQIDPEVDARMPKRRIERPAAKALPDEKPVGKPSKQDREAHAAGRQAKGAAEKNAGKKKPTAPSESRNAKSGEAPKKKTAGAAAESKSEKSRRAESSKKKTTSEGLSKRKPR